MDPLLGLPAPTWVAALVEGALVVLALLVAPRNRRPSSALAWILLIIAVPLVGVLIFALIGSPKLPRGRRDLQQRMNDRFERGVRGRGAVIEEHDVPDWLDSVAELNEAVGALPLVDGNAADVLQGFDRQLAAMTAAIEQAESFAHVEFYVLALDPTTRPFFDALRRAVARGVTVRVLVDHLGSSRYPGFRRAKKALTAMGADWSLMLPVQPWRGRYQRPDLRNHRKLLVVDGRTAFVGSPNVIDPSYEVRKNVRRGLRWHDLLVQVHGPVVQEVDAVFITDWYSETGELLHTPRIEAPTVAGSDLLCQVAPSGPAFPSENNLALFNSLIYAAERRLSITSPYFVPDESLLGAILTAARRGVQVELFVGEIGDQFFVFHAQHSYYAALLDAGVRIHLYPAPGILHAKHITVDDLVAVVGSSNFDIRSFQLDLEVSLVICGREFVDRMRQVEDGYRRESQELTRETWERRGFWHAVVDNLARLTSAVQ